MRGMGRDDVANYTYISIRFGAGGRLLAARASCPLMSAKTEAVTLQAFLRPTPYMLTSMISAVIAAAMWVLVPYEVDKPMALFGLGPSGLDPKTFPYIVTAMWFVVSLWNVAVAARQPDGHGETLEGTLSHSVLVTVGVSFVYAFTLEPLGFVPASALTVSGLAYFYGAREWRSIGFCSVVVPGFVFVVFTRLLHVSLPPLPDWIMGG